MSDSRGNKATGSIGLLADYAQSLPQVLDALLDALIVINEAGIIVAVNRAAVPMFGYSEAELVGQNVNVLMPEPDRSQHDDYIANYLRTGQAKVIGIGRDAAARRSDGTLFPAELAVTEVRESPRPLFVGLVRDVSERKRYESMQFEQGQLERVAVAGEMAAMVAHEVRTPLNALSINVQMAERLLRRADEKSRSRARELLGSLRGEVQRINALLEEYLAATRRPRSDEAKARVPLNEVAVEALRFVRPQATRQGVSATWQPDENLVDVFGDRAKLRQVILNLLLNAIQAMPEGGSLTLRTRAGANRSELSVQDDGPGIDPEQQQRIFKPFVTSKAKGTGLGLAVCDRLVREAGGTIRVQSQPGQGATFTVRLPVAS